MNDESRHSHIVSAAGVVRSADEIQDWFVRELANELRVSPENIRVNESILAHGIDSMHVIAVVARLEDWLGVRFASDPFEDHPSIAELSQSLARRRASQSSEE